jgi:hypothetical protein
VRLRLAFMVACFACLLSCGLFVSFDYDTGADPGSDGSNGPTYAVGGTVDGLGSAKASLLLNGNIAAALPVTDGKFVFPERLADGASYVVTVLAVVAGHPCMFERQSGTIAGADVSDVAVHCPTSKVAGLANLSVEAGPLSPVFDPSNVTKPAYTVTAAHVDAVIPPAISTVVHATAQEPGASISINGAHADIGTSSVSVLFGLHPVPVDVVVTAADGVTKVTYVVTLGGDSSLDYFKASNTRESALFGASVAISGNTLVVGAPGESSSTEGINGDESNTSALPAGAVYVFVRNGTSWTQQAYIKASNTKSAATSANFGASVAIEGDTLVVGAPQERGTSFGVGGNETSVGAIASGAVYIYTRSGTTWSKQAYLKAQAANAGSLLFGGHVALAAGTLAISAAGDSSDIPPLLQPAGAVYVFTGSGKTWTQQGYLKPSPAVSDLALGSSIAVDGDTLVAGAVNGNGDQGTAYVFTRTGTTWAQSVILTGGTDTTQFGTGVAVSGNSLVVGAPGGPGNVGGSGLVYVFGRTGSGPWSAQAPLAAPNVMTAGMTGQFGSAVALVGDVMVVGAVGESSGASGIEGNQNDMSLAGAGAAFVFTRSGTTWSPHAYVKASNPEPSALFGHSVALTENAAAIGAIMEHSPATGIDSDGGLYPDGGGVSVAGAAYVVR